jgi:hypothetical protein
MDHAHQKALLDSFRVDSAHRLLKVSLTMIINVTISDCLHQVDASRVWFERRFQPLSAAQLWWRPGTRSWSIAECVQHLNATLAAYLPKIEAAVEDGWKQEITSGQVLPYDWQTRNILERMEPPSNECRVATRDLAPARKIDFEILAGEFFEKRQRYAQTLQRANGLNLSTVIVESQIQPLVPSLGGMLELLAVHERQHMWEAECVRGSAGFPISAIRETLNDAHEVAGIHRLRHVAIHP